MHGRCLQEITSVGSRLLQIYSGSKDGTIKLWDLKNGTCVQTWDIPDGLPVESLTVVGGVGYVSCFWRREEAGRAFAFDFVNGISEETRVKLSTPRDMVSSSALSGLDKKSQGHQGVIVTHDKHTILVWDEESFAKKSPLALHHTKAFTCVAVSPDGSKIAAGDVTGRILIWHDVQEALLLRSVQEEERKKSNYSSVAYDEETPWAYVEPPAATVHWHAHPVGCVTFSMDGHYILSGGQEAVLVIWDVRTGARTYLPRLGAALTGIAPCSLDAAKYALRQADNTVRIVNTATMNVECSIHGVRPLPAGSNHSSVVFEPYGGTAVIVGPHAVLQFYDIVRDLHVDRLQLSRRNIVSMSEGNDKKVTLAPLESALQCMVFTQDAGVLATVERRPDTSGALNSFDYVLKFWDRVGEDEREYGSPYRLNTVAENPHRYEFFVPLLVFRMHVACGLTFTHGEGRYCSAEAQGKELPSQG